MEHKDEEKDELSKLHDCPKCHGKMVAISIDLLGVTRCGYCHEVVDYTNFFTREMKEPKVKKFLAKLKEDEERKRGSRAKKKKYTKKRV